MHPGCGPPFPGYLGGVVVETGASPLYAAYPAVGRLARAASPLTPSDAEAYENRAGYPPGVVPGVTGLEADEEERGAQAGGRVGSTRGGSGAGEGEYSPEEEQVIAKLKARDAEVRAHEAAHIAAGGGLVSGSANYTYQTGPDGRQYAVGGEVSIDISAESGDPEATIRKMQRVRTAAMAPGDPSGQDFAVAAAAAQIEAEARAELAESRSQMVAGTYGAGRETRGTLIDVAA